MELTWEEIKERYPSKEFGLVWVGVDTEHPQKCNDTGFNKHGKIVSLCGHENEHPYVVLGYKIYLEHSCDEWEIGTVEDAKDFAKSLDEAIKYCEDNPLI